MISICTKRDGSWERDKGGGIESSFWAQSSETIEILDLCHYMKNATFKHQSVKCDALTWR